MSQCWKRARQWSSFDRRRSGRQINQCLLIACWPLLTIVYRFAIGTLRFEIDCVSSHFYSGYSSLCSIVRRHFARDLMDIWEKLNQSIYQTEPAKMDTTTVESKLTTTIIVLEHSSDATHLTNGNDTLSHLDVGTLPAAVRERLAELDVELNEGTILKVKTLLHRFCAVLGCYNSTLDCFIGSWSISFGSRMTSSKVSIEGQTAVQLMTSCASLRYIPNLLFYGYLL